MFGPPVDFELPCPNHPFQQKNPGGHRPATGCPPNRPKQLNLGPRTPPDQSVTEAEPSSWSARALSRWGRHLEVPSYLLYLGCKNTYLPYLPAVHPRPSQIPSPPSPFRPGLPYRRITDYDTCLCSDLSSDTHTEHRLALLSSSSAVFDSGRFWTSDTTSETRSDRLTARTNATVADVEGRLITSHRLQISHPNPKRTHAQLKSPTTTVISPVTTCDLQLATCDFGRATMSSSNHPPPEHASGGHFDLLRRATQKMMYRYVEPFSILIIHRTVTSTCIIPRARLPSRESFDRRARFPALALPFRQTGLPCQSTLHFHVPFVCPRNPHPLITAQASSRTPNSAPIKSVTSVTLCSLLAAFPWTSQDVISAVLIGQAIGRPTQKSP